MANILTTQDTLNERLGYSLSFPIQGAFQPISGIDMLLQDIQALLLTVPGERVYRPTFGCNLRNSIWESIDSVAQNGAAEIRSALTNFESRITVTSVTSSINRNTDLIIFSIRFIVNSTGTTANLVFPLRTSSQISAA
jgi:phage baseplate assembly protein W